jgi:riboflavin kinase / FMN adenylyltransferase
MIIVRDTRTHTDRFENLVVTIGSFDGVHLGHRRILDEVIARAKQINGQAAVLTLDPHPRQFFSPQHAPPILTTLEKKAELLEAAGVDVLFILRFDGAVASLPPVEFVDEILLKKCGASALVVGHDFRFGHAAAGDFELLNELAQLRGFTVSQAPALLIDGERVSSTSIRELLLLGDLEAVTRFLGRPYSIVGEVEHGRGIGTELGFPTANITPHHNATPAQGVYAGEAIVGDVRKPAAINIGFAPTIPHDEMTIEAFLLDFDADVRGQRIEITFLERLRGELKFESRDALVEQIGLDVERVRAIFTGK